MRKTITLLIILSANIIYSQVPNYVPINGLVGWWPFNGNANDESGNGNNGTVNGAALTLDRFNNTNSAFNFDGLDDYIQGLNPLSNLTSNYSISCYVNISSWQGGLFIHVGIDQNAFTRNGFGFGYGNTQAVFNGQNLLGLLSNVAWYQSGYQFSNLSTWYHIVIVRNLNTLSYYVNGILVGSNLITTIVPPSNSLFFGSGSALYANFNGKLDDIGIWNRALTQTEITALYTSALSSESYTNTSSFQLYPNPANDVVQFKSTEMVERISIYNALGQLVQENKTNSLEGAISIEHLAQGSYFVKVNNQNTSYTLLKK
jgi:hypothetical protein